MHELTVQDAGIRLRDGSLRAVDLTRHALERIARLDGDYHAFIAVTAEHALKAALHADKEFASGIDRGPLHGIPYAVKDVIDVKGMPTTCASRLHLNDIATEDAVCVKRMREAGAVLLGKLMTYEFAVAGPSIDLAFPPAINPQAPGHITGGSSSGCASAIAAGFVRIAIGTDGGGSARSPASYCGIVGLKPSKGLVPTGGVAALSLTLDHVGPMAATVEEVAICLDVLTQGTAKKFALSGVDQLHIGYARSWSAGKADASVQSALDHAAQTLRSLGARVEDVELPEYELFEACGTVIIQAEAFAVHADRLRSHGAQYGAKALQNLVTGAVLSKSDIAVAMRARDTLSVQLDQQICNYDAVLVANTLTPALLLSEFRTPTPRWTEMRTFPFNISGHPALALPMGRDENNLPLGLQLVGKHLDEVTIIRVGMALEKALAVRLRFPDEIAASSPGLV